MRVPLEEPSLIPRLAEVLAAGGVAIMPCDTVYGLVGIAPETEERIRLIKGRGREGLIRLIGSAEWLPRLGIQAAPPSLARFWPGPLTLVLPTRRKGRVVGSAAVRVPADRLLLEVLQRLDRALFSTSVNRSGEPPLWRIAEIEERFERSVDLVVQAGDLPGRSPSTIVDASGRPWRILRQGALAVPPELLR